MLENIFFVTFQINASQRHSDKFTAAFGNAIANWLKGRALDFGYIDLRPLSMDRIVRVLAGSGIREIWAEFPDWKIEPDSRCVHVTFRCPGG